MDDEAVLLSAYADGELDDATAAAIEARIASDPAAARIVEMHRETSALLKAALSEHAFAKASDIPARHARAPRAAWRYGWAAAAAILIGTAGFGGGTIWSASRTTGVGHLVDEAVEYHEVFSKEKRHLVEVPASDSDHLKAWLGQRVGRELRIPDLSRLGLTFAGGRMLVIDGNAVADLLFTRADGPPIAVCVLAHEGKPEDLRFDRRGVMQAAVWSDGTHAFIVVGEGDRKTIRDVASRVADQI